MRYYLAPPPMNPVARLIAAVLAVAALVGALFFGLVILVLAVGLGILGWLLLTVRLWWLRRRHGATRPGGPGGGTGTGQAPGGGARKADVIDAEYEVVSRSEDP